MNKMKNIKIYKILLLFFTIMCISCIEVKADDLKMICIYNDSRINTYIKIYESGKVTATGYLITDGLQGQYHSEDKIGNTYTELDKCPEYVLVTYGYIDINIAPFYVSNSKSELEEIVSEKKFVMVDFSEIELTVDKKDVWAEIFSKSNETVPTENKTISCNYTNINNCSDCEITIDFYLKLRTDYKYGTSVVKQYSTSSNITSVDFLEEKDWQKRKVSGWIITPFSDYLSYYLCPEGIFFTYDKTTKKLEAYISEIKYDSYEPYKNKDLDLTVTENTCESLLGNPNDDGTPAYYLQIVFNVMKYVGIVLLIVTSSLDFFGAIASQEDGAMKKVANKCLKRLIYCAIIFFIPVLLNYIFVLFNIYSSGTCGIS